MIAFLAFALPLTLYLGFPSCMWNFDGVACAAALELGQPAYFFHANHLLYGFLGFLFWKGIGINLGLSRALPALQLFTSLLACSGLIGLYRLLLCVVTPAEAGVHKLVDSGFRRNDKWVALLLTLSLAFTAAFWTWSIEAQVYPLGFVALAWATYVLIQVESQHKYLWVGILHGAAILGHLMHFLWIVPVFYWIHRDRKAIKQYLLSLGLVTLIPYLLVLSFVIAPGHDLAHVLIWLKGSVALTTDRSWQWHSVGWSGPWVWLKSSVSMLWGSSWPYGDVKVMPWMWALAASSIVLFLTTLIRGLMGGFDRVSRFSLVWLGTYGLFLSTWEPQTLCYRMTDILPLGLLLATGLRMWRTPVQILVVILMLTSTLSLNLFSRILPMHRSEENAVYQEVLSLSKITQPNTLYVAKDSISWLYLLYFTGRTAWYARSFDGKHLEEEIARQKQHRPVYIQTESSWRQIQ